MKLDLVQDLAHIELMQVNIHEAKTHFSDLISRALSGEEVIIAKNGKALVVLKPLAQGPGPRTAGLSRGKGVVAEDFDAPLSEDTIREFEK